MEQARSRGEPALLISAWREIGRMLNFYGPERAEVIVAGGDIAARARLELMTDAELVAVIDGVK